MSDETITALLVEIEDLENRLLDAERERDEARGWVAYYRCARCST